MFWALYILKIGSCRAAPSGADGTAFVSVRVGARRYQVGWPMASRDGMV